MLSTNSRDVGPGTTSQKGGHDPTDWEMELIYHRLIQMSYLDVISAKASKKQEEQAKSQIYWFEAPVTSMVWVQIPPLPPDVRLERSGTGLILRKGSKGKFKIGYVQW